MPNCDDIDIEVRVRQAASKIRRNKYEGKRAQGKLNHLVTRDEDHDHDHDHDHDLREITAQSAQATELVAMGFEEGVAVAALTATDNDFESALTLLLSQDAAGDAREDASTSPW